MVVVDDLQACMIESGELIEAVSAGMISIDSLTELATIMESSRQPCGRTPCKSVGIAIEDWAAMNLLTRTVLAGTADSSTPG